MRFHHLLRPVVATGLALAFGLGTLTAPQEAAAQAANEAVARCRAIEAAQGADFLEAIYGSFGGCVVNFAGHANENANNAHGCEFLVELGVFATRGACIHAFRSTSS